MRFIREGTIQISISQINEYKYDRSCLEKLDADKLTNYQKNNLYLFSEFIAKTIHKIDKNLLNKNFLFFLDDANKNLENSFAFSPPSGKNNFPVIDPIMIRTDFYQHQMESLKDKKIEYKNKEDLCYWRGALTGTPSIKINQIKDKDEYIKKIMDPNTLGRMKLCLLSKHIKGCDFKLVRTGQWLYSDEINDELSKINLFGDQEPFERNYNFKYLIDIDGNSNSWPGLFMKLCSGSCILKVGSEHNYYQWFYKFLKPWIHFVPVNSNLSDLNEKLEYLRKNEDIGRKIAQNSEEFFGSKNYEEWEDLSIKSLNECLKSNFDSEV